MLQKMEGRTIATFPYLSLTRLVFGEEMELKMGLRGVGLEAEIREGECVPTLQRLRCDPIRS